MSLVRIGAQRASGPDTGTPGDHPVQAEGGHVGRPERPLHRGHRAWRNRRHMAIAAGLAVCAGLLGSSLSAAATPTVTYESQVWWRRAGISVPDAVGAHIHTKATVPADGYPVDGRLTIPVTVTLHAARGTTNWFRMGTEDHLLYQRDLSIGPCGDCSSSFDVTIDVSGLPTGRHELRMSANNPDEDPSLAGEQRMYQSTGYQICVRSCTPSYRSGLSIEARGWYTDFGYQNVRLDSPPASLGSGATIGVKFGPGADGQATEFAGVYIDPNFHAGSAGIVVREWSGEFGGSVKLPNLAPGPHRLVLVSSDGQNAGVLVVPFTQGSGGGTTPTPDPTPTPTPTTDPTPTPTPTTTPPPASEPAVRTTLVPDTSRRIDWSGRWNTAAHSRYRGGSVHWTTTKGASATFKFNGTRIVWIGPSGPTRGKAKVFIDGKYRATVDLYATSFHARRDLFKANLRDGRHTITIRAMGTAGRPMVAIDGLRVTDPT